MVMSVIVGVAIIFIIIIIPMHPLIPELNVSHESKAKCFSRTSSTAEPGAIAGPLPCLTSSPKTPQPQGHPSLPQNPKANLTTWGAAGRLLAAVLLRQTGGRLPATASQIRQLEPQALSYKLLKPKARSPAP